MSENPFFREEALILRRSRIGNSDSHLLEEWRRHVDKRYRGKTRQRYPEAVDALAAFAQRRFGSIGGMSEQALCDYLMGLVSKCRHFGQLDGRITCRASMFPTSRTAPPSCNASCPSYDQIKVESYVVTEGALRRFFEFAAEHTDYPIPTCFVAVTARIRTELKKRRIKEREDPRYPRRSLTMEEIERLFTVLSHPRDRAVAALMIMTGIRRQEAMLLRDAPELRDRWERERLIVIEDQAGIKRMGNPYLVINDQLWAQLESYFRWKDGIMARAAEDDPRRALLFTGRNGREPMGVDSIAKLWAGAGRRAGIRVHPLIDAPLTSHSARYTFCRLLEDAGFESFWLARLRGDVQAPDSGARAAWTYAKRGANDIRDAYLKRFPNLPF